MESLRIAALLVRGAEPESGLLQVSVQALSTDPGAARPAVVLAHGFGGTKADAAPIAQTLARTGYTPVGYYGDPVKSAETFVKIDGRWQIARTGYVRNYALGIAITHAHVRASALRLTRAALRGFSLVELLIF